MVLEGRITVRPPWERPGNTPIDLVIDPGQAFGTGAHASTRLCLELMLSLRPADRAGAFVDLGCGSGVLAIAAAKLGWQPVRALDNDPASVHAARANAIINGVAVAVGSHDLRVDPPPEGATIAANLLAPLLLAWAQRLGEASRLPDRVVASGLLVGESDRVAAAFAALGLLESQRRERGEWAALLLERRRLTAD